MITLIKNGTVISMDLKRDKQFEIMDVVFSDNKIIYVGTDYQGEYDKVIDATGKIVMPGLINCHTHLGMSIFRATNDDLTLDSWLNDKIWPIEDKLTDDDLYYTTLLSMVEMIKTGSTCFNDMYFGYKGSIPAIKKCGVRGIYGRCLMGNMDKDSICRVDDFKKLYEEYKDDDKIRLSIAPHALYTCNLEYLKLCSDLAKEYNLPIHIHLSENMNEVKTVTNKFGMKPMEILDKVGMLEKRVILGHGTFLSDSEINMIKDCDVSVCTNPVSNLNLGCGIADLVKYKKNGINVCLGTDGQGSGNSLNLFYTMSLVDYLQKGKYEDPTVMSSYDVLKMATINGAKALGIDDIGSIEVGKKADIIILDISDISLYPAYDLIPFIVHNCFYDVVDTTIIDGRILMMNKELKIDVDLNILRSKIEDIRRRLM
jgi:5-methylthioadenosine/S-adenosylhomocysteine deaminase